MPWVCCKITQVKLGGVQMKQNDVLKMFGGGWWIGGHLLYSFALLYICLKFSKVESFQNRKHLD